MDRTEIRHEVMDMCRSSAFGWAKHSAQALGTACALCQHHVMAHVKCLSLDGSRACVGACILAAALAGACSKPPAGGTSAAATAAVNAPEPTPAPAHDVDPWDKARPPWPNMATAAWGQRVLEHHLSARTADGADHEATLTAVLDALHELERDSERRALDLALAWHRKAMASGERGTACGLAAAALVLDPTVEGYKERLTDAAGLAAYAGTLDAAEPIGQAARAMVGAATGAVEQARRLVEVIETTPQLGAEPRLFLALTRKLMGERGGEVLEHLKQTLVARPGSARARAALAELWLELGIVDEAQSVLAQEGSSPWLKTLRGRAMSLAGRHVEAVTLLRTTEGLLPEGRRGDALYWLGLALLDGAGTPADVEAVASSLEPRAGFAKEAAVLHAQVALRAGDPGRARSHVEPHMRGPPTLPVDGDAAWCLAEACAALGDITCMDGAGARALGVDGDEARLHRTRAATAQAARAGIDVTAELREAHRASPFDAALATTVGEPVVPGGPSAAARVRAARRALARQSGSAVGLVLAPLTSEASCRVCRALVAAATSGSNAVTRAAAALKGRGPPLAIDDVVRVAEALGAAPTPEARALLNTLERDERAAVKQAVARARADHADPEARQRRNGRHGDHPAPAQGSLSPPMVGPRVEKP